jgi:hypothetical protein
VGFVVDTSVRDGGPAQLRRYWTEGKGLAKWASSPTPYRALVAALRAAGVPEQDIHGLAATYYHIVFKKWPGKGR